MNQCLFILFSLFVFLLEGPPNKFNVGIMDPPFRVDVPFSIPLQLHDEFNHPTKPTPGLKPILEAT